MINHARTLLLNVDGANRSSPDYPGEEYVPVEFVAQTLPLRLSRIRNMLFGPGPDRAMLNYRLRQLLTLVHSTELGDYLYKLDNRITYWPLTDTNLYRLTSFGSQIGLLSGSTNWEIMVIGQPATMKSMQRLVDLWQVDITSSTSVTVTHKLPGNEIVTSSYTANSGISNQISLPGSDLKFVITVGNGAYPSWLIQQTSRPLLDLPELYIGIKDNVMQDVEDLFSSNTVEPYLTCKKLWLMSDGAIAYKLGAIVVALAYKLDELYHKVI